MSNRMPLLCAALLVLAATPAAAQDVSPDVAPAASYAPSAPVQTPQPQAQAQLQPSSAPQTVPSTSYLFPPTDRRGRVLMGTRHEMQSDRGLWGAGLGLFLGGWALDIVGTAIFNAVSNDRDGAAEEDAMAWSIVPFVGPIVQLALEAPHPALPLTSALMQIGGLVMFCLGITSQHDVEIPIYGYADAGTPSMTLGLDLRPTDGGGYASLTLHTM